MTETPKALTYFHACRVGNNYAVELWRLPLRGHVYGLSRRMTKRKGFGSGKKRRQESLWTLDTAKDGFYEHFCVLSFFVRCLVPLPSPTLSRTEVWTIGHKLRVTQCGVT